MSPNRFVRGNFWTRSKGGFCVPGPPARYNRSSMPFQEVVEAEGHLIDSHIMENIFDKVVEYHGRFEVEQFRIGKTNSEPSYLRLKVETQDGISLDRLLHELL